MLHRKKFILSLAIGAAVCMTAVGSWLLYTSKAGSSSTTVIGGADGSTAIFVAGGDANTEEMKM